MNKEKLDSAVRASGYKLQYLSDQLGLSRFGLYSKMIGRTKFKSGEIEKLKYMLRLSDSEAYEIFYE